ncbi:MAG TPA: hypothetical protein VKM56_13735 [Verrucomicrobiae bacterium]|nr:hypothetical protein [Verrucomicrobiae bacterium]
MRRRLLRDIGLALICGMFLLALSGCGDELASKTEWSVVQAVEAQHRERPSDSVTVQRIEDYAIAGIPVKDGRKTVWILLNARNPPFYKQLPKGNYSLSKEELRKILASARVTSTVENCLESHLDDLK